MTKPALYRKYRSASLDEIVGQDHIVDILRANLKAKKHAQSYLLTGPRGVGKTSIARILAYAINDIPYGENHLDIIEIDAASNGSVDDARELRDRAMIAPAKLPYKIYIIDEVHMLSRQAFDALLKLIEEPPAHAVFIMATTEIDKVPATIKSRSEQYHFHLVPTATIAQHLEGICKKEKIDYDEEALELLAGLGRGSLRDAISHLDQVSASKITCDCVEKTFGLPPARQIKDVLDFTLAGDILNLVTTLNNLKNSGVSTAGLTNSLLEHLETLALDDVKFFDLIANLLEVPKSSDPELKLLAVLGSWFGVSNTKTAEDFSANSTPDAKPKAKPKVQEIVEVQDLTQKPEAKKSSDLPKKPEAKKTQDLPQEPDDKKIESKPVATTKRQINWGDVIDEVSKTNQLFATNLSRANYEFNGDIITVCFATEVARKVADTAKYKKLLIDTIKTGYGFAPEIEISQTLVDKQAAAESKSATEIKEKYSKVSAIMGL